MNTNPLTALVLVLEAARDRLTALAQQRDIQALLRLSAAAQAQRTVEQARIQAGLQQVRLILGGLDWHVTALAKTDLATHPRIAEERRLAVRIALQRAADALDVHPLAVVEPLAERWNANDQIAWDVRLASHVLHTTDGDHRCDVCGAVIRPNRGYRTASGLRCCSWPCADQTTPPVTRATCALCCGFVYDDRFARRLPSGERITFCSTECAAEAAQNDLDQRASDAGELSAAQAEVDQRHEIDERELDAMYLAADRDEADGLDLDEAPF